MCSVWDFQAAGLERGESRGKMVGFSGEGMRDELVKGLLVDKGTQKEGMDGLFGIVTKGRVRGHGLLS